MSELPSLPVPQEEDPQAARAVPPDKNEDDFHAHAHDVHFQALYDNPKKAAVLLRTALRREMPELEELVDLGRLEKLTLTLSTPELRDNLRYDLLLCAPFWHTDEHIVFHPEHQSTPDKTIGTRLNRYGELIGDAYQREFPDRPRPMVCPVVIYANREHRPFYRPEPGSEDSRKVAALLAPYLQRSGLALLDVHETDDEDLWIESDYPAASMGLIALKIGPENPRIDEELLEKWGEQLAAVKNGPDGAEEIQRLLAYFRYVSKTPPERVRALAASLGREVEERYMTTAEMIRAEGRTDERISSLMKLLELRLGPVPADVAKDIQDAGLDQLRTWFERAATAATLDEVFPDRRGGRG